MLCKLYKTMQRLVIIAVVIFIIKGCNPLTNDGIIDICDKLEGKNLG